MAQTDRQTVDEQELEHQEQALERQAVSARHRPDERPPNDESQGPGSAGGDVHAAGSTGGGSAVGGLAGTNVEEGAPDNADIEAAAGSGNFDVELPDEDEPPYSGIAGGAVGGTPAEKRSTGGNIDGGIAPRDSGRDGTIGTNPKKPR